MTRPAFLDALRAGALVFDGAMGTALYERGLLYTRSLDEASLTLRAGTLTTIRRVVLPLLRPAIVASLVFSFVRAMTAISAVVFLVSADYDMATSYIIGRVENGDYGLANAYCAVLIVVMVAAIGLVQLLVGQRELGRRQGRTEAGPAMAGGA